MNTKCTIFENIYANKPFDVSIDKALERIKSGKSKNKILEIRAALDKEKANVLKTQLPSVCFSGTFTERKDDKITSHSGFLVLDFDNVQDIEVKMGELSTYPFVYAAWVSPRGNGVKSLCKIADGKRHREHFDALKEIFPDADKSGVNVSRVCYESWDENIYINTQAETFTKIKTVETFEQKEKQEGDDFIFKKLLTWLSNRSDAFVTGERNLFIFKLSSACCRFGVQEQSAIGLILSEYPSSNDFTRTECVKAIHSAYKANRSKHGTAAFERDVLVEKTTRKEIVIDSAIYDTSVKPRDVVYGADVKKAAMEIHQKGYETVKGIGISLVDDRWKAKKKEITLLTGIGNYGKSTKFKYILLMRVILYGEKFALFAPEDFPPEEFYHDFVEMLLGKDCSAANPYRPSVEEYSNAYDFISRYIFFIYPKDIAPTPDYIKERFLELIIKEKINGCGIDPFNQMMNDWGSTGGRSDKYLETVLSDFARFAQVNDQYFFIIAHPTKMTKDSNKNYPCPDVFDIADGAMWNNKMDNILVYHRPFMQTDPENPTVEFHSKKIRRQKTVGKKGFSLFEYHYKSRRFLFEGVDHMQKAIDKMKLSFQKEQAVLEMPPSKPASDIDDFSSYFPENEEIF